MVETDRQQRSNNALHWTRIERKKSEKKNNSFFPVVYHRCERKTNRHICCLFVFGEICDFSFFDSQLIFQNSKTMHTTIESIEIVWLFCLSFCLCFNSKYYCSFKINPFKTKKLRQRRRLRLPTTTNTYTNDNQTRPDKWKKYIAKCWNENLISDLIHGMNSSE